MQVIIIFLQKYSHHHYSQKKSFPAEIFFQQIPTEYSPPCEAHCLLRGSEGRRQPARSGHVIHSRILEEFLHKILQSKSRPISKNSQKTRFLHPFHPLHINHLKNTNFPNLTPLKNDIFFSFTVEKFFCIPMELYTHENLGFLGVF